MAYAKPHLTSEEQLNLLRGRGLACSDRDAALGVLRAVGYYRFSAYVYPFRELLPSYAVRHSDVHHRSDKILDGVTFDHIVALWNFDRRLRLSCLDAVETLEIGLRSQVAHVLGRRDPFGHLSVNFLDQDACDAEVRNTNGRCAFDHWTTKYQGLQSAAKSEDYVRHHLTKYGGPLPIWVAVEFLDLGALVRLYNLLDKRDQNEIAKEFGIRGGPLLGRWLRDLNYLRNLCAHHARLWNRTPTYKPGKFNSAQVGANLQHVATSGPRDMVYILIAELAYLVTHIDPHSRWPESSLRTVMRKFPDVPGLSPERDMGFPEGWQDLPLWTQRTEV